MFRLKIVGLNYEIIDKHSFPCLVIDSEPVKFENPIFYHFDTEDFSAYIDGEYQVINLDDELKRDLNIQLNEILSDLNFDLIVL